MTVRIGYTGEYRSHRRREAEPDKAEGCVVVQTIQSRVWVMRLACT